MPCRCDHKTENDSNSRDEERSSKYSFVSALCMSGGEGDNSYSTNSLLQVFSLPLQSANTKFNSLCRCSFKNKNKNYVGYG